MTRFALDTSVRISVMVAPEFVVNVSPPLLSAQMIENVALPPATVLPTSVSVHAPGFSVDEDDEPMRMKIWRSSLFGCVCVEVISMAPHAVWMVPALSPGLTVIDAAQPG